MSQNKTAQRNRILPELALTHPAALAENSVALGSESSAILPELSIETLSLQEENRVGSDSESKLTLPKFSLKNPVFSEEKKAGSGFNGWVRKSHEKSAVVLPEVNPQRQGLSTAIVDVTVDESSENSSSKASPQTSGCPSRLFSKQSGPRPMLVEPWSPKIYGMTKASSDGHRPDSSSQSYHDYTTASSGSPLPFISSRSPRPFVSSRSSVPSVASPLPSINSGSGSRSPLSSGDSRNLLLPPIQSESPSLSLFNNSRGNGSVYQARRRERHSIENLDGFLNKKPLPPIDKALVIEDLDDDVLATTTCRK